MFFVSRRVLKVSLFLAASSLVGFSSASLRADATFDSGTTTISTGTDFGTNLYVGYGGTATMEVTAGGYALATTAYLGFLPNAVGTVLVTGGTWANSRALILGYFGDGALMVDGGSVTTGQTFIGYSSSAKSIATVSGGTWINAGALNVGSIGVGTLEVLGNGDVSVGTTLRVSGNGTINMGSGGQLTAAQVSLSNATTFTGDPLGLGFGTITATSGLTYGGALGLHFSKVYEGDYNLFSFTSLTPSGQFKSLFSTGTSGGSVYDSISFTRNGSGLWSGMATNGQTVSFNEGSGVLSFSAVPEPSTYGLALVGIACGGYSMMRRRRRD